MNIRNRLKIMMFLQFAAWGAWLITLGAYMMQTLKFTGAQVGIVYGSLGIASFFMPALMGMVADRWVKANLLYSFCHLIVAISMILASYATTPSAMTSAILMFSLAYMPTISLSNSLSYYYLRNEGMEPVKYFPPIRVFGTVGFILSMWVVSLLGFELSKVQLYIAAGIAGLLTLYSLTLPSCPTSPSKASDSLAKRIGLDALSLFKNRQLAIFFIFAMLLGASLQITNNFSSPFLHDFAAYSEFKDSYIVRYPSLLISLSQISETLFIMAIPFFLMRFGIKTVMLMSMFAWTLRFGLFAYGDPSPFGIVLLVLSMIVYGCAFDFFNISGSIFVDKEVSAEKRASAQGLFMAAVNGVGAYAGSVLSGYVVDYFTVEGVKNWHHIWLTFAAYSLVIAIVFAFVFKYKHNPANG